MMIVMIMMVIIIIIIITTYTEPWLKVHPFIVVYMVGITQLFRGVTPCSWVSGYRRFERSTAYISRVVGPLNP